jgi:hypothetical protein
VPKSRFRAPVRSTVESLPPDEFSRRQFSSCAPYSLPPRICFFLPFVPLCNLFFFCRSQVSQDLAPFSYCMGTRVMVLSCGSCSCSCVRNSVPCLSVIGPVIGIRDEDASCSRIIFDSRSHFSLGVPPGGSDSRHIFFRGFSSSVTLCSSGA